MAAESAVGKLRPTQGGLVAETSYMGFDRDIDIDIEMDEVTDKMTPFVASEQDIRVDASLGALYGSIQSTSGRCHSEPYLKRRIHLTSTRLTRWGSLNSKDVVEHNPLVTPASCMSSMMGSSSSFIMSNQHQESRNEASCSPTAPDVAEVQPRETKRDSEDSGLDANNIHLNHVTVGCSSRLVTDHHGHQLSLFPIPSVGSYTSIALQDSASCKDLRKQPSSPQQENGSVVMMLSCMYAKLLITMGICFPLSEVISKKIPISYYEGFYLFLYLGSIMFLLFVYIFLLRPKRGSVQTSCLTNFARSALKSTGAVQQWGREEPERNVPSEKKKKINYATQCGSFYLRLGAVAFGIGSMIYSGLEFGQFFELEARSHCYNVLHGLTPITRTAFTFIQMYFIFLNSRVAINKYKALVRVGLMHVIATNLCVWLHVLVQETKHGILMLVNSNVTAAIPAAFQSQSLKDDGNHFLRRPVNVNNHTRNVRSVDGGVYTSHSCRRSNIMGELVQDASHFLFPCTIEYSLICAAILYIMWKNVRPNSSAIDGSRSSVRSSPVVRKPRHHYQVDCAKANKGLFTGILVLVLSIISIILFFVFISNPSYKHLAIFEARVVELAMYLMTSMAVIAALFQVRELRFNKQRNVELDNILLIVAQSGLYLFTMFSIIGSHFAGDHEDRVLALLTALACLVQGTLQTIFILDASRRSAINTDQTRRKPGREMVTFLLLCNFAMWAINTLETQRTDSNPVQLQFYGFWAWTIITHVTTPLAIYFRFHSTVCLCDIWKRTYKLKPDFV